jgi:signal transduction histidine kinase
VELRDQSSAGPDTTPRVGPAGVWHLLNDEAPLDPALVRALCWVLLVAYTTLWGIHSARDGWIEQPQLRLPVVLWAIAGIRWGPSASFRWLRGFTIGLALLLPGVTYWTTAVEGYHLDRLALSALATFAPLCFLFTGRDLIIADALLLLLHIGIISAHPPTDASLSTLASVQAGAIAAGNAAAVLLICSRSVIYRGLLAAQAEEARGRHLAVERAHVADLKARFVAQTSHEFRTPLAVILAANDALRRYADRMTPAQRIERLDRVEAAARKMCEMIDEVLAFGEADAEKLGGRRESVDVAALCREIVADAQLTAQRTHDLVVSCAEPTLCAELDPKLLRRVLGNLVGNAIKYSPDGGRIELACTSHDGDLEFRVSDHGLGIAPADQPQLFEPFARGANVGVIQGSGLGLTIVQAAVKALGGDIRVQSELGQGSTFVVMVPAEHTRRTT